MTVVIFSGSSWVVNGTNANLNANAQAMVTKALNSLGASLGTPGGTPPPPTGGGNSYEAESATLAGGAAITACKHCSGSQKISFLKQGSSASFSNVTESAKGSYTLKLYFMSVGHTNTLSVTVNGTSQSVALPSTADYNTVVEKDIKVSLNSGNNKIVLSNSGSTTFNVDRIAV